MPNQEQPARIFQRGGALHRDAAWTDWAYFENLHREIVELDAVADFERIVRRAYDAFERRLQHLASHDLELEAARACAANQVVVAGLGEAVPRFGDGSSFGSTLKR